MTDNLTPFMLANGAARGRLTRASEAVNTILSRHHYPEPVAQLLGELLVAASMLASQLKRDGVLTLQMKGNGPVRMMVADAVYGGALRGYADLAENATIPPHGSPQAFMGEKGCLAITLDPGDDMQRYQGVVALEGENLRDILAHYFTQSQQLEMLMQFAVLHVAAGAKSDQGKYVAAGYMLERLPCDNDDDWRAALAISHTLTAEELLDDSLSAADLLYRLFHEDGAVCYDSQAVSVGCRCSRERIMNVLMSMELEDRVETLVDGQASVHCQFCNKTEYFSADELGLKAQ
jgi:molecular chaperone Hsp33